MNKLTAADIIERLEKYFTANGMYVKAFAYHDFSKEDVEALELGPINEVYQRGGEGQGDTWFSVKYLPDHDVYLRVDGFYQSHYGTDFYDGWKCVKEVKPKEKVITVYE